MDSGRERLLRFLRYFPGPLKGQDNNPVFPTSEHTDSTWLTMIAEDELGGLEVRPKPDGPWIPVVPVPNALLVNMGNVIAHLSRTEKHGPFYPAVCHRVRRLSTTKTRDSLIHFYGKNGYATGGCKDD